MNIRGMCGSIAFQKHLRLSGSRMAYPSFIVFRATSRWNYRACRPSQLSASFVTGSAGRDRSPRRPPGMKRGGPAIRDAVMALPPDERRDRAKVNEAVRDGLRLGPLRRPKPMTSNSKAEGRFGKQDFRYVAGEDVYICPAGEKLTYRYTNEENGLILRRYWTNTCQNCAIKRSCTTGKERRITRWEHEHVLDTVQQRLDQDPQAMRRRRETVEHPFGTLKMRMGATHFLMKTLPKVASEMALSVLAYNLTRVMNIVGTRAVLAAIRA